MSLSKTFVAFIGIMCVGNAVIEFETMRFFDSWRFLIGAAALAMAIGLKESTV